VRYKPEYILVRKPSDLSRHFSPYAYLLQLSCVKYLTLTDRLFAITLRRSEQQGGGKANRSLRKRLGGCNPPASLPPSKTFYTATPEKLSAVQALLTTPYALLSNGVLLYNDPT